MNKNFSEGLYLEANPDVKAAVELGHFKSGFHHYKKFGKREGRPLIKILTRRDKVFYKLDKTGLGLEIGPRPETLASWKKYDKKIPFFMYRHIVKPGISG